MSTKPVGAAFVIDYSGDGQPRTKRSSRSHPSTPNLPVSKAGWVHVIDGTKTVGAAWARMGGFLDELEAVLLAPDLRADVVTEFG